MLLGEVAPAAPALGPLIWIALLLFAFAFVWTVRKLLEALFHWVIVAINTISLGLLDAGTVLRPVEQTVSNALGSAESKIDSSIGASWHLLARYMDWLWRELRGQSSLLLSIASYLPVIGNVVAAIRALVHRGTHTTAVTVKRVKLLEREYHGIDRQLRTLEREFHGIDQTNIRKQLRTLDKELATIEAQTIPAIQQADNAAADAISNLYEWAKGKASLLGIGTFATAVAAAIGIDAFRALRCPSFLRNFGNRGCGLWDALESITGWLVDLFIITDLCDVIPLLETAYSDVATPAIEALTAAIDSMPCVEGNQAAPLIVPALHLPASAGLPL